MKTLLLTLFSVLIIQYSQAQNINDNKVSFDYIQLPLIKVRDTYKTYETRVEHAYLESNKDSLTMQELRKQRYETEFSNYSQDDNSYPYAAAIMCNFATRGKDISRQKVIPDFENIKKFRSHVCFDFLSTGMW